MTKADAAISSIPLTIVTSDDFHNDDRPEWLPNNWTFETIVRTGGASAGQKDCYYFEPVFGSKFRLKPEVNHFLKTGLKREKLDLTVMLLHHLRAKKEEEWLEKGKEEC
ncbi:hypothetical protein H5410_052155 [Solanum commersonii]|uniref:MBD domain-containing protein n=1 Tax=Solanum commersonii TaxID=4109 RepID=A0A9J5X374_SOLCO|nr:hypothetical protein H5410_052155 [Solanum commersonii]